MARKGKNPKRSIAAPGRLNDEEKSSLAERLRYVGSAHHKRSPGDYGFQPPCNPRQCKSLCDDKRVILTAEAVSIFRAGITKEMFSNDLENVIEGIPKYVWGVDSNGEAYEAKIGSDGYHGYRLGEDDDWRKVVLKTWKKR